MADRRRGLAEASNGFLMLETPVASEAPPGPEGYRDRLRRISPGGSPAALRAQLNILTNNIDTALAGGRPPQAIG